jgi:hypothetical protein
MALSLSASLLPSGSRSFGCNYVLTDWTGDLDLWVVFGTKASGTPAVYTDLTGPQVLHCLYDVASLQAIKQPGRTSLSGTVEFSDGGSVGDRGFVAIFHTFPSGSDPVIVVVGPFTLGA